MQFGKARRILYQLIRTVENCDGGAAFLARRAKRAVHGRRLIASRRLPFHCAYDNDCHDLARAENGADKIKVRRVLQPA
jgi:hypothetical protein